MGRIARVVVPGIPYHITHRGNRGQDIFVDDADRLKYKEFLEEYSSKYGLAIWAYCLMTNHVHIEGEPKERNSLAETMRCTEGRFALWHNRKHGWKGHLWGSRYFSTPLDAEHTWAAARYIELNPVRAGLVSRAEDYEWSSARSHAKGRLDSLLSAGRPFPGHIRNWSDWLRDEPTPQELDRIRQNTLRGRPTGSDDFVRSIEERIGRKFPNRRPTRRS